MLGVTSNPADGASALGQREAGEPVTRFEPFVDPVAHDAGVLWTRTW